MTAEEVRRRVAALAAAVLDLDPARLQDDAPISALELDSLALVEWTQAIEAAFDVELPEEEVLELGTVADLVAAVQARLEARRQAGSAGLDG